MDLSNEILIRPGDLIRLRNIAQDIIKGGDEWFIWECNSMYIVPSFIESRNTRAQAELFCWNPEKTAPFFHAVPAVAMNEMLTRAISATENSKAPSSSTAINLDGCEQIGSENIRLQRAYDGVKQQLINIDAWDSEMEYNLKAEVFKNGDNFLICLPFTYDYHPLNINMSFQKIGGLHRLHELEVSGIKVPDLVLEGISLKALEKEAGRYNWRGPSMGATEFREKLRIVDDLKVIRRSPNGRDLVAKVLLKYEINQFIPEQWPSEDERKKLEVSEVFSCQEGKPKNIREVCRIFVEKPVGRKEEIEFSEKKKHPKRIQR